MDFWQHRWNESLQFNTACQNKNVLKIQKAMTINNPISVTYSDSKLRILVEEYITMQKKEFTFKEVCSYILYRAMEEERTKSEGLYESNELAPADCERVSRILEKIIVESRLTTNTGNGSIFTNETMVAKVKE